ncbi:unnamed protein product [Diamesa hyperborea]
MEAVTSGSSWTTILTEITRNNRTDGIYPLTTAAAKDNSLTSTPSYFSLPKHTHITEHPKVMTLSSIQIGSSGIVSPTILNIPVTTISDSNFMQTTKSSTPLPPSSQSRSSTVSSVNRNINTTTSNLSIMSTSRLITSTSEKSKTVSKSGYGKTSSTPDAAVSKLSTLLSSSLATTSKQLIPSTTSSTVADQDNKITSTNRLKATTTELSQITEKVKSSKGITKPKTEGITTISVTSNKPTTESTLPVTSNKPMIESTLSVTSNKPITESTLPVTSNKPTTESTLLVTSNKPRTELTLSVTSNKPITESTISVTSNKLTTESSNSLTSKLSSPLSTIGTTTSNVPIKTTPTPSLKPYNSDRVKGSNIRAGDSAEEEAEYSAEEEAEYSDEGEAEYSDEGKAEYSDEKEAEEESTTDSNIKDKRNKPASERHLGSSEKTETVTESKSSIQTTPGNVESSSTLSSKIKKDLTEASSSTVADQDTVVNTSNPSMATKSLSNHTTEEVSPTKESLEPKTEGITTISVTSIKPTTESTLSVTSNKPTTESNSSVVILSQLSSSSSTIGTTTSVPTVKTTTKPFIKPHHFDNMKASNIRAGDSSEEESGEEPITLTTQRTTSSATKSSTISSSSSVPLIVSKIPSDLNIKDKSSNAALERHLASSEKVEPATESSSSATTIEKDLKPKESEKRLNTEASSLTSQDDEVTASSSTLATSKLSLPTQEASSSKLSSSLSTVFTTISNTKPHHLDIDDTQGKSAIERHLDSSEKIEPVIDLPSMTSSTPKKVESSSTFSSTIKKELEDTESQKPLIPKASSTDQDLELITATPNNSTSSIVSANKSPTAASSTSNNLLSSSTLETLQDSVTETTLMNIPATPKTLISSSEPDSTVIISSLLTTEAPFPTVSLALKLLNTGQSTLSSTITSATGTSKKLNHAARFEEDDNDNDSGVVIQQSVEENDSGSNDEEDEVKLATTERTRNKTVKETAEETEEETLEATEEPVKRITKKPLIKVNGKSNTRPKNSRRPLLAVKV